MIDLMYDLRGRDFYHTCYSLSGLSVAQYFGDTTWNICSNDESLVVSFSLI